MMPPSATKPEAFSDMVRKTRENRAEVALVRIGGAQAIPNVLRSLGAEPCALLAEVGVDPALFDDPDNLITYIARSQLINACVARTGCLHFGLLVGQHGGLHDLGLLGLLVKYSPDVETALHSLVHYFHLHARGAGVTLEVHDNVATLGYAIHVPQSVATDQIGDGALAFQYNILAALCGPGWKPLEVRFAHRKPDDIGPFRRFFKAPLAFDAEQNALVFSAEWLNRPLPGDDPALRRLLLRQVDALAVRHAQDLPGQVRAVLRNALLTGQASADQVAALFSMHSRTLNRRLNAFGTSFQQLVDACSLEIAQQMLESSAMEVRQIALALGYADPSAFTRAFRRWSGTTPAQWRRTRETVQQKSLDPAG
jgi:AraC-like DNA-binding protein